jgi:hypothetical protein
VSERNQLAALQQELANLQAQYRTVPPPEKPGVTKEIQDWHRENDALVAQLESRLASSQCRRIIDETTSQPDGIEVEWESGLGASNDNNLCSAANRGGESCGFYSAGHRRRQIIWNWPTSGDRVHVEGRWQWDRGHSPYRTEIHPARLVAIQRHLPALVNKPTDPCATERARLAMLESELRALEADKPTNKPQSVLERWLEMVEQWHADHDGEVNQLQQRLGTSQCSLRVLATRVDVFASGDGGALWNNRLSVPTFVTGIPMNDRDYSFVISHTLPRPSLNAQLRWWIVRHEGDTFGGEASVQPMQGTLPQARVNIPWHSYSMNAGSVFARTIYFYWDEGLGVPEQNNFRLFRVTLEQLIIYDTTPDEPGDAEFRIFAEVGGDWLFLNDLFGDSNILDEGLGDAALNQRFDINRDFLVVVPQGDDFRVHAGGWEADGVNDAFGKLSDPNGLCFQLTQFLNDHVFTAGVYLAGAKDDPTGQVNARFILTDQGLRSVVLGMPIGDGIGEHFDLAAPAPQNDINGSYTIAAFRLIYRVDELVFR